MSLFGLTMLDFPTKRRLEQWLLADRQCSGGINRGVDRIVANSARELALGWSWLGSGSG